jgi:serine/threonine protein kinase
MGGCMSKSEAANDLLRLDDPLTHSLRGNREVSLHDHLVSERSAQSVDDSYDLMGLLQKGSHSQIIKITGKRYSNSNNKNNNHSKDDDDNNTYILKLFDPASAANNDTRNKNFAQQKQIQVDSMEVLKREAAMLMECDHPNIIKLYEFNQDRKRKKAPISLVLEYCSGGTIASRMPYTDERQVSRIVRQVCEALAYLHRKKIVHRDIHMSNILFESPQLDANIKLIDFACATVFQVLPSGKYVYMKERVGTLETMAPDVIKGKYSPKADIWSTGVVAYQLLMGRAPFQGDTP